MYGVATDDQNVVDHSDHGSGGHQVCHDGLRGGDRRLRTGDLRGEQIFRGAYLRVKHPHRLVDGFAGSADAADNLAGVFSIPGVNVDQVPRSEEYLVTKFTRLVVIHGSDQNDQFRVGDPSARVWLSPIHIVPKYFGPEQFFQLSGILDKTGDIRGFKAEHIGISLCDYPGLVFAKVSLCEILAYQIFRLHFITVADDKFHRTLQRI